MCHEQEPYGRVVYEVRHGYAALEHTLAAIGEASDAKAKAVITSNYCTFGLPSPRNSVIIINIEFYRTNGHQR